MASRLKLHEELCEILKSRYVYFQPPESVELNYPCIVYELAGLDKLNANNGLYKTNKRYSITVMDRDPDSEIYEKIINHFKFCEFDRPFASENLNHWVLTLYY